ncbi:hypothetical protein SADUNF_Sadunf02G0148500 [Salix dunnii]|uniref:Uncharacterized protein n=1 Tax=Salix dunnii TaxID=1413687 RepID=A0A835N827_9ROSI|nr:hypothetical protein SADUNF_Sadunf02G0148500 [Salix dunnii]
MWTTRKILMRVFTVASLLFMEERRCEGFSAPMLFVSEMHGLVVKIAKNFILAGVKTVALQDGGILELWDLFSNFVLSENDVVFEVDGEKPHTGIISSISNDNLALVLCVDDERVEFLYGDLVVLSRVKGMTDVKDGKTRKIRNARQYSFNLEDTTSFATHEKGGIVTQVKHPKVLYCKPLREAIKDPGEFLLSDFSKCNRPPLLHSAFQALGKFVSGMGRFPVVGSEEDAQKLIYLANHINENARVEDINPKLLRHFAFGPRSVLKPIEAMIGDLVGQEKMLEEADLFVVRSGALGCESLKTSALMGVSCGEQGRLTLTDDDVIEKSNLSRQFHFRDWNMGQRCLYLERPLFESGTLGAKCNTWIVIPNLTENYGASRDPSEKQTHMRTVHSFPHSIDHCLTWTRSEFEGLVDKTPSRSLCLSIKSTSKRFPHPLQLSATNPCHLHFVMAASILRVETFGISVLKWAKHSRTWGKDGPNSILEGYHMDLIAGIANMRARNYSIPEFDKLKGKFIAGRLIPIISNTFVNLALPLLSHLVHLSFPSRTRAWNMVTSTQELGNYVDLTMSFQNSPKNMEEIPVGQFKTLRATRPFKQIDLKVFSCSSNDMLSSFLDGTDKHGMNWSFFTRDIASHDPSLQTSDTLPEETKNVLLSEAEAFGVTSLDLIAVVGIIKRSLSREFYVKSKILMTQPIDYN